MIMILINSNNILMKILMCNESNENINVIIY